MHGEYKSVHMSVFFGSMSFCLLYSLEYSKVACGCVGMATDGRPIKVTQGYPPMLSDGQSNTACYRVSWLHLGRANPLCVVPSQQFHPCVSHNNPAHVFLDGGTGAAGSFSSPQAAKLLCCKIKCLGTMHEYKICEVYHGKVAQFL